MINVTSSKSCRIVAGLLIVLLVVVTATASETTPELEDTPIILQRSDVLPKDILRSDGYRIDRKVQNDGLINTYTLYSPLGAMTIESTELLRMRINELNAIGHIEELKQTSVFKEALKKSAMGPLNTAKGLVTSPVKTVSGVATGIGRWFSDMGRSITSDDPYQANFLSTAIGYAASKRAFAYQYGIDPYTTYEPVQKALAEVARTNVAGGLTIKLAFKAVEGSGGRLLSATGTSDTMRKLIRDKSPAELRKINKKKLKAMGVNDSLAEALLENTAYNPQEMTLLVGELDPMKALKGRSVFIEAAAAATEGSVARFMRIQAQMMGSYRSKVAPLSRLVRVGRNVFAQRKDGILVGMFPLDYVAWTIDVWYKEQTVSQAISNISGVTGKEMWILGKVSDKARKALEKEGWQLRVTDNL